MTTYPAALAAHLAGSVTTVCQCWRLTRADGIVMGFTDHDLPLEFDETSFEPQTGFSASEAQHSLGLSVDSVDVEGALSSAGVREQDIAAGLYDGALVETFLVSWASSADFALLRKAVIGRITLKDGRFVAELQSMAESLDRPDGRTVRRNCDAELGDRRCGFSLAAEGFHGVGVVLALEAADTVRVSGLEPFAAGWFSNGLVTWTSGGSTGLSDRIIDHRVASDGARLTLWPGRPSPPAAGDGFAVVAGCDKAFATCKAKFANELNFRGFPHLPGNDAAYGYVTDDGVFDGGPLVP